jgi:hypothetical protein
MPSDSEKIAPATAASSSTDDHEKGTEQAGIAPDDVRRNVLEVLNDSPESRARERAYLWKLDTIILPVISALYFFEYIDRGNIAVRGYTSFSQLLTTFSDLDFRVERKTPGHLERPRNL